MPIPKKPNNIDSTTESSVVITTAFDIMYYITNGSVNKIEGFFVQITPTRDNICSEFMKVRICRTNTVTVLQCAQLLTCLHRRQSIQSSLYQTLPTKMDGYSNSGDKLRFDSEMQVPNIVSDQRCWFVPFSKKTIRRFSFTCDSMLFTLLISNLI